MKFKSETSRGMYEGGIYQRKMERMYGKPVKKSTRPAPKSCDPQESDDFLALMHGDMTEKEFNAKWR